LFAARARDSHAPVGPTPTPSMLHCSRNRTASGRQL
jgi:hypothetical protein